MSLHIRAVPCYVITCDGCDLEFSEHYVSREIVDDEGLETRGWLREGERYFCPECQEAWR